MIKFIILILVLVQPYVMAACNDDSSYTDLVFEALTASEIENCKFWNHNYSPYDVGRRAIRDKKGEFFNRVTGNALKREELAQYGAMLQKKANKLQFELQGGHITQAEFNSLISPIWNDIQKIKAEKAKLP